MLDCEVNINPKKIDAIDDKSVIELNYLKT